MTANPHDALWDRLVRGNPIPDPEVLRPSLPALRLRREVPGRRVERRVRLGLVATTAVAILVLGVTILASDDSRVSLGGLATADAAAQALEPRGDILHVVFRTRSGVGELATSELWLAPDGRSGRARTTSSDGQVLSDAAINSIPRAHDTLNPIAAAREMLRAGQLVPVGSDEIGGRAVERFESKDRTTTWYFASDDLQPVRVVLHPLAEERPVPVVTDFDLFERLEDDETSRKLLVPPVTVYPRPVAPGERPPNSDSDPRP